MYCDGGRSCHGGLACTPSGSLVYKHEIGAKKKTLKKYFMCGGMLWERCIRLCGWLNNVDSWGGMDRQVCVQSFCIFRTKPRPCNFS